MNFFDGSLTNDNQRQKNNPIISFIILVGPKFIWVLQTGFLLPIVRTNNFFLSSSSSVFLFFSPFFKVFCFENCSDLLQEKMFLWLRKTFENSRLKAENLQNSIRTMKGQINYWHRIFSQLEVSTSLIFEKLWCQLKQIVGMYKPTETI